MNELDETPVPRKIAEPYFTDVLPTWQVMGRALATKDLSDGSFFTFWPPGKDLTDLRYGGVLRMAASRTTMVNLVHKHLSKNGKSVGLLEHPSASPSDKSMQGKLHAIACENSMLFVATPDLAEEEVDKLLGETSGYGFVAILTLGHLEIPTKPFSNETGVRTTSEALQELCDAADSVIVEAFDGEGFLVWSRSS